MKKIFTLLLMAVFGSLQGQVVIGFDNLRADLSTGVINGLDATDPNVTIGLDATGNDLLYSFSFANQDLDDGGLSNDTLTWDLRVEGWIGSTFSLVGDGTSSVTALGTTADVGAVNDEFGLQGNTSGTDTTARYLQPGDTLRFTIENVVLSTDISASIAFDGFDAAWFTTGDYILGTGSNLPILSAGANGGASIPGTPEVFVLTATTINDRIRDLDGQFTVTAVPEPSVFALISGFFAVTFVALRRR
ncbi:hypothetical protein G0Q06_06350 [Puniceicoccales bacterium CK1056]|uniref:PEP-CTERM protein-sorting domain-containing protein n=1 Tax=Oceanipulchritudo coccoides TaxID=2706888 RepID=A0A6B2LZB4_9BACT|nr:hypothetical protein [Oceanipulchritudo coccoides]NDV62061.1 hypothetical protein [Oceanipulchritudo coccoides]